MLEVPEVMRMAQELARHSGARQSIVAKNIANADTPGFRARDIESFQKTYQQFETRIEARQTRAGHMEGDNGPARFGTIELTGRPSPNGNSVSLEEEMVRATRAQSSHTLALTIYKSSLDIIRATLGRGR